MKLTDKMKTGIKGEEIACKFLVKHNYIILDRNYRKKWGEIDIIAKKDNILHFIEVKTVSRVTDYMPEENVHMWKLKRLGRAIQTYILEKKVSDETEWQIDVMAVFLAFNGEEDKIRMTENVIL